MFTQQIYQWIYIVCYGISENVKVFQQSNTALHLVTGASYGKL